MKGKQYLLCIVLNNVSKTKEIIKTLKRIDIKNYTLMNTFGSYGFCNKHINYEPIIAGSYSSSITHEDRKYNKTFYIVLKDEEHVKFVMDEIDNVLGLSLHKPGQGIMFTIPVYKSKGIIRKYNTNN